MTVPVQSPYPEQSQATTILVLGILGIVCCGLPLASLRGSWGTTS